MLTYQLEKRTPEKIFQDESNNEYKAQQSENKKKGLKHTQLNINSYRLTYKSGVNIETVERIVKNFA